MAGERGPVGSHRSFAFILIVSIFTGGLYWFYWYYKTNEELKEYAKAEFSPVMRILLLAFGWILLGLGTLYAYYIWLRDISEQAKKEGVESFNPIVNLVLLFIPFGSFYTTYKVQATLNKIWEKAGGGRVAAPAAEEEEAEEEKPSKKAKEIEKVYLKCPRCKYKNLEDANYCLKCGQKIGE